MIPSSMFFSLPVKLIIALAAPVYISRRAYRKKSLNLSGALAAFFVGFFMTVSSYCFFLCLLVFFVSSSALTKWRSEKKKEVDSEYKEGGQRNWIQVVCNGGIPLLVSILYLIETSTIERPINFAQDFISSSLSTALVGALACSNGDTWASEIGTAIRNTPRLITTFQKVPVGTNGGVSLPGTLASAIGGFIIGVTFWLGTTIVLFLKGITMFPMQWPVVLVGLFGGIFGSMCDSFLGATVQYSGFCSARKKVVNYPYPTSKHISGRHILDNHLVNLLSAFITAVMTPGVAYMIWREIK